MQNTLGIVALVAALLARPLCAHAGETDTLTKNRNGSGRSIIRIRGMFSVTGRRQRKAISTLRMLQDFALLTANRAHCERSSGIRQTSWSWSR